MLLTADFEEMKKVIITVAITGGLHGKEANPNLPEQPDEQAQSAYDCYNAGASICHLHVRDKNGVSSGDLNVYEEAITKIRSKSPILVQVGNGIGQYVDEDGIKKTHSDEHRMKLLDIKPKPDIITINAGTFHFSGVLFPNSPDFNRDFVKGSNERKIPIECEVYDISHVANVKALVAEGLLKEPVHYSLVLGIDGGIPATPENMLRLVAELPEGSSWQAIAISRYQLPLTVAAMCMGANIRTGLEDNVYIRRSQLAKSNAELVERVVKIAHDLGREVATVEETKKAFGILD